MAAAIGIDVGTTYCCVAYFKEGKVEICPDESGSRVSPSFVGFNEKSKLVGEQAKRQFNSNPGNTIYGIQRLIGRSFYDLNVQTDLKLFPFAVVNIGGKPRVVVKYRDERKEFTPEEILTMIISNLKQIAEQKLGSPVHDAVVTIPAHFNDAQREATKEATVMAGLNILRLINDPTAASISFGLDLKSRQSTILVYDLGAGTLDVSILTINDGVYEVISTAGDAHLGGDHFDTRLFHHLLDKFKEIHGNNMLKDITRNKRALRRLRSACEKVKRKLSEYSVATVGVESLFEGIDFTHNITRAKFEEINSDLFQKSMTCIDRAVKGAKLKRSQIDHVIMVGGSSYIPRVRTLVSAFFYNKEIRNSVPPDEAIAYGAAVQAAILNGDTNDRVRELLLLDVTPLTLGIENSGGIMNTIIPRNTRIPCRITRSFTTHNDFQPALTIEIYEGERSMTLYNHLLGKFELRGIPHAQRGIPEIEVTFDIDRNNILVVSAKCKGSDHTDSIRIINDKTRLSGEEVQKMVEDSAKYRLQDDRQRRMLEAKNFLEGLAFRIKNCLADEAVKKQLSTSDHDCLSLKACDILRWCCENENARLEDYITKRKELEKIFHPIVRKISR